MLILLGLGVLWMAVLLPPIIRHRNALGGPVLTLVAAGRGSVRFDPTRLRSVGVAAAAVPVGVGSARRRRRDLLVALGGMAAFTFLAPSPVHISESTRLRRFAYSVLCS